ncbi:hypothetical protein [Sphingobium nicotianae]|uniref:Lipoprotein n=1 Tax=Sphingobium nicotianae TaxID=2782607 RepID=A0A9X1IRZ3_9SPHN|nr:hypothetical protein [Sphingobium nicotianae]MBT2187620.1 hypothetical protein [Sphingobium nicotianae]
MNRSISLLGLSLFVAPLAACVDDGYGVMSVGMSYPYSGYYDGFYGPIYDGYWGSNGFFYYRQNERDRFRRGGHDHFRREGNMPGGNFRPMQGNVRPDGRAHMPHFDGGRGRDGRPGRDEGGHDHH